MNYSPPKIDNRFICIINRDNKELAALITSYISSPNMYNLIFEFPSVTTEHYDYLDDDIDEHHISRTIANEFNIKVKNAINQVYGCEYLIIAGLSEEQKSYLTFLEKYNIIEIQNYYDVETNLEAFNSKKNILKCRSCDILNGLHKAIKSNSILKIDEQAEEVIITLEANSGIIVVEDINKVSCVISVIYATSLNLSLYVIPEIDIDKRKISDFIEKWKNSNNDSYLYDLSSLIYPSIEDVDFASYQFATFFTVGIPYSLIIKNVIPCTHVHLYINPDFFVFNAIYYQNAFNINSAIVFSPLEFIDEETDNIINTLKNNNYYVAELVDKNANAINLDYHIKEFPFNLLHICSHGGEIGGYDVSFEFIDRDGNKHIVEYDEVVTFDLTQIDFKNPEEKVPVVFKYLWRKFDGYIWRSEELKSKNYPHYVYSDMLNQISKRENMIRKPKDSITNSCAIKCYSSYYQAMFNIIAGIHSPIIFNNTCWSWSDIADHFISSGARGYIGTLWNINNDVAKQSAEHFYSNLFSTTIMNSLHDSLIYSKGSKDENIYIYYGLHFSSLKKGISLNNSKEEVVIRLISSLERWKEKLSKTKKESVRKNIQELIKWNATLLATKFKNETINIIGEQFKKDNGI